MNKTFITYERQIYRVNEEGVPLIGLCNVSSITNLLNRACGENAFSVEDTIYQVTQEGVFSKLFPMKRESIKKVEKTTKPDYYGNFCDGYFYEGDTSKVYQTLYHSDGYTLQARFKERPGRARVIELLKKHPEGLFAYFLYREDEKKKHYHAVVITRIDDEGIWVIDPMSIPINACDGGALPSHGYDPKLGQRLEDSWIGKVSQWPLWEDAYLIRVCYLEKPFP